MKLSWSSCLGDSEQRNICRKRHKWAKKKEGPNRRRWEMLYQIKEEEVVVGWGLWHVKSQSSKNAPLAHRRHVARLALFDRNGTIVRIESRRKRRRRRIMRNEMKQTTSKEVQLFSLPPRSVSSSCMCAIEKRKRRRIQPMTTVFDLYGRRRTTTTPLKCSNKNEGGFSLTLSRTNDKTRGFFK